MKILCCLSILISLNLLACQSLFNSEKQITSAPLDSALLDTTSVDTISLDTISLDTALIDTALIDTIPMDSIINDTGDVDTTEVVTEDPQLCLDPGSQDSTISVLMLGNSLLNGVSDKLISLIECAGFTTEIQAYNPGGHKIYQHLGNSTTLNLIAQGFDHVIFHEQSAGIHSWHSEPYPLLDSLKQLIEDQEGQAILYQTWGYEGYTRDSHIEGYNLAGEYLDIPVYAVGEAWKHYEENHQEETQLSLFSDDRHASQYGQSLIAYTFYAYLTQLKPSENPALGLDASIDAALHNSVETIVFGSEI